jgi:hypothetical protein
MIFKNSSMNNLAYAKEVEISQNWKSYTKLSTKYYELRKYNLLKIDHDKLKKEVHNGR